MGTQAVQARHTVGAWPEFPCGYGSESPPQAILSAAPSWLPLVLLLTPQPGASSSLVSLCWPCSPPSSPVPPPPSPLRYSSQLKVAPAAVWPTSTSSTRTCCPLSGATTCSWRRQTPTSGHSRAGRPAPRPAEEVPACLTAAPLWGSPGPLGRGAGGVRGLKLSPLIVAPAHASVSPSRSLGCDSLPGQGLGAGLGVLETSLWQGLCPARAPPLCGEAVVQSHIPTCTVAGTPEMGWWLP